MEFMNENDIVILVETFLTEEWHHKEFYGIHALASQGFRGRINGGITCLIKPSFCPFKIILKTNNIVALEIKSIRLIATYFQPDFKDLHIIDEIGATLTEIDNKASLILAGDLNCKTDKQDPK